MKKIFKVYYGFIFLLVLTIAGCTPEGTTTEESGVEEVVTMETVPVKKQLASYTLDLPGELEPYEEVLLYAKVRGFVKKMHVDRGSKVKKGQLLATLDAPEISQQFLAAAAKQREVGERLLYSRQNYDRLKEAAKNTGAVALAELDKANAQLMGDSASYMALKAEMTAAEHLQGYLRITAPFDGIITSRGVSQGALVGENDKPMFSLSQQDRLRLIIAIPGKHANAVHDSSRITFATSSHTGEIFSARISRCSQVLDPSLRSLMAEFDLENEEGQFNGGEYVQTELYLQRTDSTLWVPASSVVNAQSGMFVLKVENNTIHRIPVRDGVRKDSLIEIFGGLSEHDKVVVKGSEELREGMKINTK